MAKCFWTFIVLLGFCGACFLINSSYNSWNDSPITTTISTHPLDDLDFPLVTVCPPEGSNTALNYDLMALSNVSFSDEDREVLTKRVYGDMIEKSYKTYSQRYQAFIKHLDVKRIYDGYMSVPKPFGRNGFKITVSDSEGSVQFGLRDDYDEAFYEDDQEIRVALKFPLALADQVGDGALVVELAVDTRVGEDWQEFVEYGENEKYKINHIRWGWQEAESSCRNQGGQLASVRSDGEKQEIEKILDIFLNPHTFQYNLNPNDESYWVGGTYDVEGVWHPNNQSDGCSQLRRRNYAWEKTFKCFAEASSICKFHSPPLNGKQSIKISYSKRQLELSNTKRMHTFWVHYRYKKTTEAHQSIWKNKRTSGFVLTWRLENSPVLEAKITKFKVVETPGFRQTFDAQFFRSDHLFKAKLELPDNVKEQVGNGYLMIELDVDTRQSEVWDEEVIFWEGDSKFKLDDDLYLSWDEAEEHCKAKGGHLASVSSNADRVQMNQLSETWMPVWVGGRDQSGKNNWTWTDGSPMTVSLWHGTYGNGPYCSLIYYGEYSKSNCLASYPFICKSSALSKGDHTLKFEYQKDKLDFSSFNVWYSYKYQNNTGLDTEEKRMTGFRLGWFIKDENGSKVSKEVEPASAKDWKAEASEPVQTWQDIRLHLRMLVAFTQQLRIQNKTFDDMVALVVNKKYNMTKSGLLDVRRCKHGQIPDFAVEKIFKELNIDIDKSAVVNLTSSVANEAGVLLYSLIMFCSEEMSLELFFRDLISTETPQNVLQSSVNTILSEKLNKNVKTLAGQFYLNLESLFNIKLGQILLALSSPSQMRNMLDQDLPFFHSYTDDIRQCVGGHSCDGIKHLIGSLGK